MDNALSFVPYQEITVARVTGGGRGNLLGPPQKWRAGIVEPAGILVDIGLKGIGLLSENKVPRHFLLALEIAADCRLQLKYRVRNIKKEPVVRDFFYYGCEIEEVNQPDRFRVYLDFLAIAAELFAAPGPPPADDDGTPAASG